jgi:aryl-alcohol dehydrogenase-like predicted oxidoreductase/histidinol phosphatase-like enzyme/predicted kinase
MQPRHPRNPWLGIGCMRFSTEVDRDDDRAVGVLHAGLDAGVNFLDTADAYCLDDSETGHNERLIARALATWSGDRSLIRVGTKGGLTRPDGRWAADGRGRHLVDACDASRRALGVERLDLYQLHAPDPRTPLTTSVRTLAALQRDGLVESVGLCNVTVGQIEEARGVAEIAAVQVELGIWNDDNILSGVVRYCLEHGIRLLAYRPLGGPRRARRTLTDPVLVQVAARHDATPFEVALAWVRSLGDSVVPLPGPTRIETARSIGRAACITLTDEDRDLLDERLPSVRSLRPGARDRIQPPAVHPDGEVVLIMGLPGAGKSTIAETFVSRGYERLNRDERGGSLAALLPAIASGSTKIVADNTYVSRKSRASVIQAARERGLAVRCVWADTSVEDAQVNAASRIVSRYGRLLTPEEMRKARKKDVTAFAPGVQFRYQRELEPPDPSEGFSRIDRIAFERRLEPSFGNRAVVIWGDGVLWRSRSGLRSPASADDVQIVAGCAEVLRRWKVDGYMLLGLLWQPDPSALDRLREELGVAVEFEYCPHDAGPPVCWCRKPLPGLGVLFIHRHRLEPSRCVYVGAGPQDPGFARRLGFQYREASEFFAGSSTNS